MPELTLTEVMEAIQGHLVKYPHVRAYLTETLVLPQYVLRTGEGPVCLMVDGLIKRSFQSRSKPRILPFHANGWQIDFSSGLSYNPRSKLQAIAFDRKRLADDSRGAGVPESSMLEILTLHELVHFFMLDWWFENFPQHAWITRPGIVSLHEACALYFCEHGLSTIASDGCREHIPRYMEYVRRLAGEKGYTSGYGEYFDHCRALKPAELWPHLSQPLGHEFLESLKMP